jgi:hypothetical protein
MKTIPVRFPHKTEKEVKDQYQSQTTLENQMKYPWRKSRCQRQPLQACKAKRPRTKLEERKRHAGLR